jgi:hydrogenase/urease accessory protein HupE
MRNVLSNLAAGILMFAAQMASAHPGHAPTDVAAQVSQPFAGMDHFAAFVALSAALLTAFRFIVRARSTRSTTHL